MGLCILRENNVSILEPEFYFRRIKGEYDKLAFGWRDARTLVPGEQLNSSELQELRRELEKMSRHQLRIFYKATHNACATGCGCLLRG